MREQQPSSNRIGRQPGETIDSEILVRLRLFRLLAEVDTHAPASLAHHPHQTRSCPIRVVDVVVFGSRAASQHGKLSLIGGGRSRVLSAFSAIPCGGFPKDRVLTSHPMSRQFSVISCQSAIRLSTGYRVLSTDPMPRGRSRPGSPAVHPPGAYAAGRTAHQDCRKSSIALVQF